MLPYHTHNESFIDYPYILIYVFRLPSYFQNLFTYLMVIPPPPSHLDFCYHPFPICDFERGFHVLLFYQIHIYTYTKVKSIETIENILN